MPELEQNQAARPVPRIDFDEWAALAKTDPQAFEARRRAVIEDALNQSQPKNRQRLECLQWKIDQIRDRAPNPLSACVKISDMMWDALAGPGGLKERLEQLQNPGGLARARVLELGPARRKARRR